MNAPKSADRRTYPLALLFLILTSAAILAAVAGPLLRGIDWSKLGDHLPEVAGAIVTSVLCGSLLGMILGLYHFHRSTGVCIGAAVGAAVGPLAGLLISVGTESLLALVPTVFIGSAILIMVAWLVRPAEKASDEDEIVTAIEVAEPRSPGSRL